MIIGFLIAIVGGIISVIISATNEAARTKYNNEAEKIVIMLNKGNNKYQIGTEYEFDGRKWTISDIAVFPPEKDDMWNVALELKYGIYPFNDKQDTIAVDPVSDAVLSQMLIDEASKSNANKEILTNAKIL